MDYKQRLTPGHFHWQGGYGAFSYARSQVRDVIHYIEHQQDHHHKKTFREEYVEFLRDFEIPFQEHCIFGEPE